MSFTRQTRTIGDTLVLGGIAYRLDGIEGCGGSVIVYRASYEDALNTESRHHVFIKELFPIVNVGDIYRSENGDVVCAESGERVMKESRSRFFMGNRVNLELLQQSPSGTSGNINSYEAYGTYYSVLALHGGKNLQYILDEEKSKFQAAEAVEILRKILRALEVFHKNGLLHLDISPDNILLLPEQALLIDYNSVWDSNQANFKEFVFSEKRGYSPAEIKLRKVREIGYRTDMFSVCAVFFHMLMGRPLTEREIFGNDLPKCFVGKRNLFGDIPQTAEAKIVQILMKGLQLLARKRYQNVAELEKDLEELIRRLEGKGISASALWESSRKAYLEQRKENLQYLSQPVKLETTEVLQRSQLLGKIAAGQNVLLIGPGGMGKTRFLLETWKEGVTHWNPKMPIVLYLSLKDYQQTSGDSNFIRQSILKKLQFSEKESNYQDALHRLNLVLDGATEGETNPIILLLDGLNEAGSKLEKLLLEIEELGSKAKLGILLTDRSNEVLSYALSGFASAELAPLSEEQVLKQMELSGLPLDVLENATVETSDNALDASIAQNKPQENDEKNRILSLLANPMMLFLYIDTMRTQSMPNGEGASVQGKKLDSADALIALYLDNFCKNAMRVHSGNEARRLCIKYILEHLLPVIALKMVKKKKTVLNFKEMCQISDQNYKQLQSRAFGLAFQEFREKSSRMLKGIETETAWFDFAVNEVLIEQFGLIVRTGNGFYSLLHDNFLPTLEKRAGWEKKRAKRQWITCISAITVVTLGIGMSIAAFFGNWLGAKLEDTSAIRYNKEELGIIKEAAERMTFSLGAWSTLITGQQDILESAGFSDILDNQKEDSLKKLGESIEKKKRDIESLGTFALEDYLKEDLLEIQERKGLFSVEYLQILCNTPIQMKSTAMKTLEKLEKELCDPKSTYRTRDARERLVAVYQEYLEAEVHCTFYRLAMLLSQMPPTEANEVREALRYMPAFDKFDVKDIEILDVQRAEESLKRAKSKMKSYNYSID